MKNKDNFGAACCGSIRSVSLLLVIAVLLVSMVYPLEVRAAEQTAIQVCLEDQQLSFTVPPQTINGRVMVPMRPIFEAMGAALTWDQATATATAVKGATTVTVRIDDSEAFINGAVQNLDAPATAIDGCTLAPLRFVAEAFGYHVEWDGISQTAYISTDEFPADKVSFTPDMFIWHGAKVGMSEDELIATLGEAENQGMGPWSIVWSYGDDDILINCETKMVCGFMVTSFADRIFKGDSISKVQNMFGEPTYTISEFRTWEPGPSWTYATDHGQVEFVYDDDGKIIVIAFP